MEIKQNLSYLCKIKIRKSKKFWEIKPEMLEYNWKEVVLVAWWIIDDIEKYKWEFAMLDYNNQLPISWIACWDVIAKFPWFLKVN